MKPIKTVQLLAALTLVFSIALMPAAVSAQESDSEQEQLREQINDIQRDARDTIKQIKDERNQKIKDLRTNLTDQYQDRIKTSDVQIRPNTITDREPDVYFDVNANGWILIDGAAHKSSTSIISGNAYHVEDNLWKLQVDDATFSVGNRNVSLDLVGKTHGHRLILHGIGTLGTNDDGSENQIRVLIRGHFAPTGEQGHFAIAFTQFGYQTLYDGKRIPLIQVGDAIVYPNEDVENPKLFKVPSSTDLEIFS